MDEPIRQRNEVLRKGEIYDQGPSRNRLTRTGNPIMRKLAQMRELIRQQMSDPSINMPISGR